MPAAGSRIAHYVIEAPLGAGGMGEVHAAFDERLQRRVALKLLPIERAGNASARARMIREARAASALKHPSIVTIHEVGEHEGRIYIAMELVEGETLRERLARTGPLAPARAVAIWRQACDAVALAHASGVLHRDIKCSNLMVDGEDRLKVLDFGLSKRLGASDVSSVPPARAAPVSSPPTVTDVSEVAIAETYEPPTSPARARQPVAVRRLPDSDSDDRLTAVGARMGTPGSSSLELMRGQEVDHRTDVFSLGVVLYELLTGHLPYDGRTWDEVEAQLLAEGYPAPRVDARLAAALAPALRARAEDRPRTVGELRDAVVAAALRRPARRLLLGALVTLPLAAAGLLWFARRGDAVVPPPPPPPPRAEAPPAMAPARGVTRLGGCAYSPAFVDDDTLVFDLTASAKADLWVVPLGGGAPRRIVESPTEDWRPAPGRRPGEILYLEHDADGDPKRSAIAAVDLATGARTRVADIHTSTVGAIGDTIYFSRRDGGEIRQLRGSAEEVVVALPPEMDVRLLTPSPDGKRLAFMNVAHTAVCIVELATRKLACPRHGRAQLGRPAWSHDGEWVYYPGFTGIRRVHLADERDEEVLPEVSVPGGITVSPDGRHLVYSDCIPRTRLLDLAQSPPRELVAPDWNSFPELGPTGELAWVLATDDGWVLELRLPDGKVRQLSHTLHGRPTSPAFSPDGKRLAFSMGGDGHGVYVMHLDRGQILAPTQLTDGMTDGEAVWTLDGKLVFQRADARDQPHVFILDEEGAEPRQVSAKARLAIGVLPDGWLFVTAPDGETFFEMDPATGQERPARARPQELGHMNGVDLSPHGKWMLVQIGDNGQVVYRAEIGAPKVRFEKVFEAEPGDTIHEVTVDDEGRVVVSPRRWTGELWALDAPAGSLF